MSKTYWVGAAAVVIAVSLGLAAAATAPVPPVGEPTSGVSFYAICQVVIAALLLYIGRVLGKGVKVFIEGRKRNIETLKDHELRIKLLEFHHVGPANENCQNCMMFKRRVFEEGLVDERRWHRIPTAEVPTLRRREDSEP